MHEVTPTICIGAYLPFPSFFVKRRMVFLFPPPPKKKKKAMKKDLVKSLV